MTEKSPSEGYMASRSSLVSHNRQEKREGQESTRRGATFYPNSRNIAELETMEYSV